MRDRCIPRLPPVACSVCEHPSVPVDRTVVGMLKATPEPFELIATTTLWSIHIAIFAKASVLPDISGIQVHSLGRRDNG